MCLYRVFKVDRFDKSITYDTGHIIEINQNQNWIGTIVDELFKLLGFHSKYDTYYEPVLLNTSIDPKNSDIIITYKEWGTVSNVWKLKKGV